MALSKPSAADNASFILDNYSLGVRRVPIWELGISPLNRPISVKHFNAVGRRINFHEHFHLFKYKHGLAHEPDPTNESKVYEHTRAQTEKDELFAPARKSMKLGVFGKTHLMCWLHALSAGRRWDHDGSVMVPNSTDKALLEHLEHGMYVLVIRFEAIRDHPEKVEDLMRQDNDDQGFAMGGTLIGLVRKMHKFCLTAPPPMPGQTLWNSVREKAMAEAEAQWTEHDLIAAYNLAMTLDAERVETMHDFQLYWINPTVTHLKPEFLALVAQLGVPKTGGDIKDGLKFGWCRVALVARQLMSDPKTEYEQVGGRSLAVGVKDGVVKGLCEPASIPLLSRVESFLAGAHRRYARASVPQVPASSHLKAMHLLLAKSGGALITSASKGDSIETVLSKLEARLRKSLLEANPVTTLPDLVLLSTAKEEVQEKSAPSSTGKLQPIALSTPVKFGDDGELDQSEALQLAARGLVIGSRVQLSRACHGLVLGAKGYMIGITNGKPKITWDVGSIHDSEEQVTLEVGGKLLSVVSDAPEKNEPKQKKPKTELVLEDWSLASSSEATLSFISLVKKVLFDLHLCSTPSADILGVALKPKLVVTKKTVPAQTLKLFPYSKDILEKDPKAEKDGSEIAIVRLAKANPLHLQVGPCKSSSLENLCPFWFVRKANDGEKANMELRQVLLDSSLTLKTKDVDCKDIASGVKSPAITLVYLTNPEIIDANVQLCR